MIDYLYQVFGQNTFIMSVSWLGATAVAYAFTTHLSSWLTGAVLFPGLFLGSLVAIDISTHTGLIIGREKDMSIITASMVGLSLALMVYYILYNVLIWASSYNRRAHRQILERCNDNR